VTLYDTYGMAKLVRNDDVAFSPGLDGGRSLQIVNLAVCISRWLRDADGKDTREWEDKRDRAMDWASEKRMHISRKPCWAGAGQT
jgi:hypothetical protein